MRCECFPSRALCKRFERGVHVSDDSISDGMTTVSRGMAGEMGCGFGGVLARRLRLLVTRDVSAWDLFAEADFSAHRRNPPRRALALSPARHPFGSFFSFLTLPPPSTTSSGSSA